ncbi:MAG: septum formation initiator family protein [Magnetospirillum sp. WYHS-4]
MAIAEEFRKRARYVVGSLGGIAAMAYFGYHAVNGERGFLAWMEIRQQIDATSRFAGRVVQQRRTWEDRVRRLQAESLDPDLLDERARLMGNLALPGDVIILTGPPKVAGAK